MPQGRQILAVLVVLVLLASSAAAAPFIAVKETAVLAAPSAQAPAVSQVASGEIVEVTHQAGAYWRVQTSQGQTGYVAADSLKQAQTRGGPLIPLVVMAAAPIVKVVVAKAVSWFKKLLGIDADAAAKADAVLSLGKELLVLGKEVGGWLKVQAPDGAIGFVKDGPSLVPLQPVEYAPPPVVGIWKDAEPIPQGVTGLTLQVEVRKADGTPVPPGSPLKRGDEYLIYVTPSADCYVRITCETPDLAHVFAYYPNEYPGRQTSALFQAGHTYSREMLPPAANAFNVSDPIGAKDVLRIEATMAGPYQYVPVPPDGMPTAKFKGGGFSMAGSVVNPTAQVVVEYPILTGK
jgi:hypothetical protein